MTYGVQWKTNSGNLAVSSEGYGLSYIGEAICLGGISGGENYQDVFTQYIIYCQYVPLVFIEITSGPAEISRVGAINARLDGGWDIIIEACLKANNFPTPTRVQPRVHCFSRLTGPGVAGWGMRLYDAAGNRAWDSNDNMIIPKAIIDWPTQLDAGDGNTHDQFFNYPVQLARPAHAGWGCAAGQVIIAASGSQAGTVYRYVGGFFQSAPGKIGRSVFNHYREFIDSGAVRLTVSYASEASVIVDIADYV